MGFKVGDRVKRVSSSSRYRKGIKIGAIGTLKGYYKIGYQNLLVAIKRIVFGDAKYKMTKKRCEEFFDNDDNFSI